MGDLVDQGGIALADIDEMLGDMKFGRIPDSAKIFASVLLRLKDLIGEDDTINLASEYDYKSLWDKPPAEEDFNVWIEKYELQFLFSQSTDEPDVSVILKGLGEIPVEDLIGEIHVCFWLTSGLYQRSDS